MKERIISALCICITVLCCIISRSCANTTTPPSGGPNDTIPPVLLEVKPENNTTNFPKVDAGISLIYNEYTVVKTASDIYVSPPQKRKPKTKVKGKAIILSFRDTLADSTTYTIDFGNALADNNEGNLAPRLVYTFSTGDEIDSMYLTGSIVDCQTLLPVKGVLVTLFDDFADSACMLKNPAAATKSDAWGYFVIRNVKPKPYMLYAYTDEDQDNKYMLETDKIGFIDSIIIPSKIVRDSIYELGSFDMKDTLKCRNRNAEYTIRLFQEYNTRQYLKSSGRIDEKMGYLSFSAPNVEINSFQIMGVDSSDMIIQYTTPTKDSLNFWINNDYPLEDSLLVSLRYMKTDSSGVMKMTNEDAAIVLARKKSLTAEEKAKQKADTLISMNTSFTPETVEQCGIKITFNYPLLTCLSDSISLIITNPKNQSDTTSAMFTVDTTDLRIYNLQYNGEYKQGYKYLFNLPDKIFYDLYGRFNKKKTIEVTLPNPDNVSSMKLNVHNANTRYIIELMDSNRSKVFRTYIITSDCSLYFPYLAQGQYTFRITEDKNNNGIFDTGNFMKKQQPEKVIMFKLPSGQDFIEIPEKTDIEQDLYL